MLNTKIKLIIPPEPEWVSFCKWVETNILNEEIEVIKEMSLKQDFINYVESNFENNPMPENLIEYWDKFKGKTDNEKPLFTENGKNILTFLQEHPDTTTWKAKDIAEEMFISSRTVSGSMRKLVADGFVEKVGQDPIIYSITEQGKNIKIN